MPLTSEEKQGQQHVVSTRRKVTFACDTCRKRRAKCSGTQPCAYCADKDKECRYDQQNRARRGPKPRKPAGEVHRAPRVLAMMPAKQPEETDSESTDSPMVAESVENPSSYQESDDDDDDYGDERQPPNVSTWISSLEMVLYNGRSVITRDEETNLNLISHLLELYWNHGSAQLCLVLPPADLMERIRTRSISSSIIYAACASVVRFSTHKAVVEPSIEEVSQKLSRYARHKAMLLDSPQQRMDRILVHCCLAEYEFNRGHGSDAWMDLAAGKSLMQIIKSSKHFDLAESSNLEKAEYFLVMMEAFYSLGTPSIKGAADHLCISSPLEINSVNRDDDPAHLLSLIHTLILIQQLVDAPLALHIPPPWSSDSRFKFFRDELERYLVHWPNVYGFTANFKETTNAICTSKVVCALIWHCCSIILDRNFLPIPYRTATGANPHTETVAFPKAPSLFLQDRVRRCEASAMAVPLLCKEVIANGDFFRYLPWLGFSCMQSALVLINQSRHNSYNRDFMAENLKLDLGILLMTRDFFHPASNWIDALSHIQNDHSLIRDAANKIHSAFDGFYGRFEGISEPNFISLERNRVQRDPSRISKSEMKAKTELEANFHVPSRGEQAGWTDSYVGFLETENEAKNTLVTDQSNLSNEDQKPMLPPAMIDGLADVGLGSNADFALLFGMGSTSVDNTSNFDAQQGVPGTVDQGTSDSQFFAGSTNPQYESELWFEMLNQIIESGESWADILSRNVS